MTRSAAEVTAAVRVGYEAGRAMSVAGLVLAPERPLLDAMTGPLTVDMESAGLDVTDLATWDAAVAGFTMGLVAGFDTHVMRVAACLYNVVAESEGFTGRVTTEVL